MRAAILLLAAATRLVAAESLDTLYEKHDWFSLRDAVALEGAPALYRGAVAYAFQNLAEAEKHLRRAVKTGPGSEQASDAGAFLISVAQIRGDYRRALSTIRDLQAMNAGTHGLDAAAATFEALSAFPKQVVSRRQPANVAYNMRDGNLFIPVLINGKVGNYILDTGANFSMISESEAKRAGMSIREAVGLHSTDSAGNSVAMRVALAHRLSVGRFEMRNVAFLVARDEQQPFRDLPIGSGGVLGIPVILAFETIRWSDGRFEAAFKTPRSPFRNPTICFDGANLLIRAHYAGKPIDVFLDTGAARTRALPLFAKAFPETIAAAAKGVVTVRGVGGSTNVKSATLPVLELQIGRSKSVLQSAEALLNSLDGSLDRFHVWAGMDLFPKSRKVTIDFRSMTFQLE